ncbi:MAG TPA: hypothetical protein VFV87_16935 [Pirellulaceae bacterium]|nr:hypothetical protein [Pirellulaceae bacterium]
MIVWLQAELRSRWDTPVDAQDPEKYGGVFVAPSRGIADNLN